MLFPKLNSLSYTKRFMVFGLWGVLLFWMLGFSVDSVAASDYAQELIEKAHTLHLAEHEEWLARGHYQKTMPGGYESVIDSPDFFNATQGKIDPQAEMEATLRSFFTPYEPTDDPDYQHAQCRFIGRYHWLKKHLQFDPKRLPEQPCPRFDRWYSILNPHQITVVYPASYLNNPASMFGHTLLRIDTPNQTEKTRLSSYAINYSATTAETNGIIFAFKGIFGLYQGHFSILPYYQMVKEYSAFENRDIWEYQLNLNADEIQALLMHLWEIGNSYSWYYFFDENCSARLLYVLDVARPSLHLAEAFPAWVIPTDTIKVMTEKGLIKQAVYRPSEQTKLAHQVAQMDENQQKITKALAETGEAELSWINEKERARVLETAYGYVQYLFNTHEKTREEVAKPSMRLLRQRSQVEAKSDFPAIKEPDTDVREGHGNPRVSIGVGHEEGKDYIALRFKPEYHDLLDSDTGFIYGTSINIFDTELRYYEGDNHIELTRFTVADIYSFAPRDRFFKPISWRVGGGAKQFYTTAEDKELAWYLDGGAGLTYALTDDLLVSGFLEGELYVQREFDEQYLVGGAPALYLLWKPNDALKLYAKTAGHIYQKEEYNHLSALVEGRFHFSDTLSLGAFVEHRLYEHHSHTDIMLSIGMSF